MLDAAASRTRGAESTLLARVVAYAVTVSSDSCVVVGGHQPASAGLGGQG